MLKRLKKDLYYDSLIEDDRKVYFLLDRIINKVLKFYDKDSFIACLELNYDFDYENRRFVDIANVVEEMADPAAETDYIPEEDVITGKKIDFEIQ